MPLELWQGQRAKLKEAAGQEVVLTQATPRLACPRQSVKQRKLCPYPNGNSVDNSRSDSSRAGDAGTPTGLARSLIAKLDIGQRKDDFLQFNHGFCLVQEHFKSKILAPPSTLTVPRPCSSSNL
mmetsp:Transcript_43099/g.168703  ORF Transcript_43099/g.168703 Transcript_43099/m.168703 type:complete len:124 (-) Transcript_43099:339-710(-)|eukprot:CAMPEP_0113964918 /NCGR_PEP_ID=MMETSP0011_2-20120614/7444_1 /TAXON_ID=101924 /ORGANISM="Rhodosorus marinus" /LENGTH=123 /DNA_ID=CAMNT_0000977349 /DNA_START=804 /DNA_END=1175 /DNA_ORIENTATION=- /assembly_acc=CAM_ASM_000156